jgi:hypothetical protein
VTIEADSLDVLSDLCRERGWKWTIEWGEGFEYGGAATLTVWLADDRHRGYVVEAQAADCDRATAKAVRLLAEWWPL